MQKDANTWVELRVKKEQVTDTGSCWGGRGGESLQDWQAPMGRRSAESGVSKEVHVVCVLRGLVTPATTTRFELGSLNSLSHKIRWVQK